MTAFVCAALAVVSAAGGAAGQQNGPLAPEAPAAAPPVLFVRDALAQAADAVAAFDEPRGSLAFSRGAEASLLDAYLVHMLSAYVQARGLETGFFPANMPQPVGRVPAPLPVPLLKALRNGPVTMFVRAGAFTEGAQRYLAVGVYDVGAGRLKGSLCTPFRLSQEMADLPTREPQRMSVADANWLELLETAFAPAAETSPDPSLSADRAEAEFLFQSGLWDVAAARFLKLVSTGPNHCFMRLVFALQLAGRQGQAVQVTEAARRGHPESGPLCALLSWLNLRNGRRDDAVLWLEQARLSDMTREGLYRYAGGLMGLEEGNEEAAAAELKRAADLLSDKAFAQLQLARFYRNRGRLQEAITYYRRGLGIGGQKAETWAELAVVLQATGDEDGALSALRQAFAVRSSSTVINRQLTALLKRKGRHADALEVLRRAAEANPHEPAVLVAYGDGAAEMWRIETAQHAFEEAADLQTDLPYARVRLAAVLALQRQYRRARDLLEGLLAAQPDYHPARIELGRVLGRLGLFGQAVPLIEAATVSPDHEVAARLALAEVHMAAGKADQAVACAQIAASSRPDAEAYAALSRAFLAAGDTAKAETTARSALQEDPRSELAHLAVARVLRAKGEADEATKAAARALEMNPFSVEALELAGLLRKEAGDMPRCAEFWRRALALNPWQAELHLEISLVLGRELRDWAGARDHLIRYAELEDMRAEAGR